jgi:hypothetical protein
MPMGPLAAATHHGQAGRSRRVAQEQRHRRKPATTDGRAGQREANGKSGLGFEGSPFRVALIPARKERPTVGWIRRPERSAVWRQ